MASCVSANLSGARTLCGQLAFFYKFSPQNTGAKESRARTAPKFRRIDPFCLFVFFVYQFSRMEDPAGFLLQRAYLVSLPRKRQSRSQKSYDKTGLLPRAGMTRHTIRLKCSFFVNPENDSRYPPRDWALPATFGVVAKSTPLAIQAGEVLYPEHTAPALFLLLPSPNQQNRAERLSQREQELPGYFFRWRILDRRRRFFRPTLRRPLPVFLTPTLIPFLSPSRNSPTRRNPLFCKLILPTVSVFTIPRSVR